MVIWSLLASAVVVVHLGFILFAVGGGLLVLRWRWIVWLHLPAVLWAVGIELGGGVCPLTPLENWLRGAAAAPPYADDFVERVLVPLVYPTGLTRAAQALLGLAVLLVNVAVYGSALGRWRRMRKRSGRLTKDPGTLGDA